MDNKNDEAHGLIGMSISSDLWFHLQGIDDLVLEKDGSHIW
jgi:hypothetical protein